VIGYVSTAIILISLSERNAIDVKYKPDNKISHQQLTISTTTPNLIFIPNKCPLDPAEMAVMHQLRPTLNHFLLANLNKNRRGQLKIKKIKRLRNIKKICQVYLLSSRNITLEKPLLLANVALNKVFGVL
jgi:hypothetical protein